LGVTHVLEGSVRKSGGRVRITAQLIDGAKNDHVWAERYDRNLDDIFALQDEISQAIVQALKLKLLPQEKKAIEVRGTDNAEAYNLFLMARQEWSTGYEGDPRRNNTIVRLCQRATDFDANYARAWALMAMAQAGTRQAFSGAGDGGRAAVDKALALDPNLAEARAVKARILEEDGRGQEAAAELELALRLDPESHEVHRAAARHYFARGQMAEALSHFEKAVALVELDFASAGMLITCYTALGNEEAARKAAEVTLARVEKVLAQDRSNGTAMGHGSDALAVLGQVERSKDWMGRALLIDPDNLNMRYNFACALAVHLKDRDAALEMLAPVLARSAAVQVHHTKIDPDLDSLRDDPRFIAMMEEAEARVAKEKT